MHLRIPITKLKQGQSSYMFQDQLHFVLQSSGGQRIEVHSGVPAQKGHSVFAARSQKGLSTCQ